MAIYKNVASQKVAVYAYDGTTAAGSDPSKTGDAANITAKISKDGGASASTNDTNPTELDATNHKGIYLFDLTQAETNADMIVITADSSTANIILDPVVIYTLDALTSADVNAEVVDAIATDARSEPTSVPAANASMAEKIDFLYLLARNKVTEDTSDAKQTYYQDDGTTVFAEATVSTTGDATTRGELTTA